MNLTELSIKSLAQPASGQKIYTDNTLPGFGVRVSKGAKSFVLTHGALRKRETIGRVGIISLKEAREEARRRLAEYTLGRDKPVSITWKVALAEYLDEIKPERKPRTHADYSRLLNRHFRFGELKLLDLGPMEINDKLDKLRPTPAEHQHAFVVLRAFMKWAYRRHYVDRNPMDRMQQPKGYRDRDRVLTDDEIVKVWNAADDSTFGRIVKLLLLTGQRETEYANLHRLMVTEQTLVLPSWLTKNSIEHEYPIGEIARALLPDHSGLLFPARKKPDKPFNGWSKCKKALDKRSGVTGWRLHDLRRTFRTKWEELGIAPEVSERYINHISGSHSGITRTYNRYRYMAEMIRAVALWETHLTSLLSVASREPKNVPCLNFEHANIEAFVNEVLTSSSQTVGPGEQ